MSVIAIVVFFNFRYFSYLFDYLQEPRSARDKDTLPPRPAVSNKVPYPLENSEIGDTGTERSRWR